jgi:hypothetical protein
MTGHRFVFMGGMPRSGTSPAYRLVGTHPHVSRLTDTGVGEDEGQFLQSVYPKEDALGGPARFGLHPDAHMTERSPLLAGAAERLFAAWSPYWDTSKPVLCEKSPANLLRSRFLQAAFPNSSFIFVSRHPVAYALAIRKWRYEDFKAPLSLLIRNWLACQRTLAEDLPHLRRSLQLHYDDVTREPVPWTRKIEDFLGLEPGMDASVFKGGFNNRYFRSWTKRQYRDGPQPLRNLVKRLWCEAEVQFVERRFEREINEFGYSFRELYERPVQSGAESAKSRQVA